MGSNDIPPPHVPNHVVPTCNLLLQIGGGLWTITYVLLARESFRSESYGMPLFALALNFAWELVYALYVAESPLEKTVFAIWLVIDCCIISGVLRYAKNEWAYSPKIAQNIGRILFVMIVGAAIGHWSFAKWWLDNNIGRREGKFYRGVIGPDTTELGFWSALLCQAYLSGASLCQLIVRQHTRGVSWSIWATRTLGSIIGFYFVYAWEWYFWREAHEYVMSPFSLFLWGLSLLCDCVYPYVFRRVQLHEITDQGKKMNGHTAAQQKQHSL